MELGLLLEMAAGADPDRVAITGPDGRSLTRARLQTAALVSVPPYHVAGVAAVLSNIYGGRRLVYLDPFDPARWLETVAAEGITHAMVVPTMLARIVDHLGGDVAAVPTLRSLAYGGA